MARGDADRDGVGGDAAAGGGGGRGGGGAARRRGPLSRGRRALTARASAIRRAWPLQRVRGFVREVSGSVDDELIAMLRGQIAAGRGGAVIAKQAAVGGSDQTELEQRMSAQERAGDDERARLVATLSTALMTSFDREDLFRVSRSVDDVLDNLYDFVREAGLFKVTDEHCAALLDAVEGCLSELDESVVGIGRGQQAVVGHALAASKASARVRERYQEALADLLAAETVTPDLLKRRELLRRLDVVGLRLGEAAAALSDGAVKRG